MFRFKSSIDLQERVARLSAIEQSQAVIEFEMNGTIITANQNFLSVMGYSLGDIQGQHHRIFVDPGERDTAEYKVFWERLRRGEYQAAEYKRIGKDGKEVWLQAAYNPVLGRNGKPVRVVKVATDITARTLQNADYAGQIAAIGASQAIIQFDLDGKILTANENFLKTMGYSLPEIQGQHHSLFVTPTERDSDAYRAFWSALRRGEYQTAE